MPEKDHNVVGMEARQLWERGYEQLEKKQWDYAMELLCMAVEKDPGFFECRMALRAAQVKKYENASSLAKIAGTASNAHNMAQAKVALVRKNYFGALSHAEKVLCADPESSVAHRVIVDASSALDLPQTMISSLQMLKKVNPENKDLTKELATALEMLGDVRGQRVVDGYGGVGTFALRLLADGAGHVTIIESGSSACADARHNLKHNGFEQAEVVEQLFGAAPLPSCDALIRHPKLLAVARALLGPDLLVWSGALFIKEANTTSYVSWHQDLTYWALDDVKEVTAWVALSPATVASGCMRFVPGSHTRQIVPHSDTVAEDNLLTRGQEIAVDVAESDAVDITLNTGQASFHHGHLFHSSGPNTTGDRRIGAAIRYITPDMKQRAGQKTLVAQVSGEDRFGHFTIAPPLSGRLAEAEFDLVRADAALKSRLLYDGAEGKGRKRG